MSKCEILFFISWLVCGCCIENIFNDRSALVVVLIALIVALISGLGIIKEGLMD